ncbi:MAG: sulfatase-like hydrolase/transferase [Rikenellaceae bacterium]
MMNILSYTLWGSAILASATSPLIAKSHDDQKNIILVMADDMGWGDVGFNGNRVIQTPHLDALAAEGIIFDRFYSSSAVSSPTRASLVTGRNPYRTGVFTANVGILRCEEITLAEVLREQNYMSGHFGKWHLGTLSATERDANRGGRPGREGEFNPPSLHGYDDSFVTESKVPTYDPMISPPGMKKGFWDYLKEGDEREVYGTAYWRHDGTKETENLSGDDSRVIMDRVLPFISRAKSEARPFLAEVWFHAPHLPCVAGPEEQAMYKDFSIDKRNFYGCITALDKQMGRLVAYLKAEGLYDNTIIYFCSDNGPEGGDSAPGSTGGLKGRKRSMHEGGIRVPGFVVCPNMIKGGQRVQCPTSTADYMPTLVELTGAKSPDRRLDGQSILPMLRGKKPERFEREKPLVFLLKNQCAVVDNRYKLYFESGNYSLYDITNDRGEMEDIIDQQPDLAAAYKAILLEHISSYRASFEGDEYPLSEKIKQEWESPLTTIVKPKKR